MSVTGKRTTSPLASFRASSARDDALQNSQEPRDFPPPRDYPEPWDYKKPRSHPAAPDYEAIAQGELSRSDYPEIRRIRCRLHGGVLLLQGRVSRFYLKQLAQSSLLPLLAEVPLENRIEVVYR